MQNLFVSIQMDFGYQLKKIYYVLLNVFPLVTYFLVEIIIASYLNEKLWKLCGTKQNVHLMYFFLFHTIFL